MQELLQKIKANASPQSHIELAGLAAKLIAHTLGWGMGTSLDVYTRSESRFGRETKFMDQIEVRRQLAAAVLEKEGYPW